MTTIKRSKCRTAAVITASVAALLLASLSGTGWAEESSEVAPGIITVGDDPAQVLAEFLEKNKSYGSPLVIPGADFKNDGLGTSTCRVSAYSNAVFGTGVQPCEMQAPVYLPHGATIASVWFFLLDNDDVCFSGAGKDVHAWMKRVDNYTVDSTDTMVYLTSSSYSSAVRAIWESDVDFPVVLYPDYSYYVATRVCAFEHKVYAAVIFYS